MQAATTAPASLSAPQHMQALAHANRVRIARARLKRAVCAGEMHAAEVVAECPWEVESMPVGELLRSQRRWGTKRVTSFLRPLAVSETRLIGQLTERQRDVMAQALREATAPQGKRSGSFDEVAAGTGAIQLVA